MLQAIISALGVLMNQFNMFEDNSNSEATEGPMAHRYRPTSPEEYIGFQQVIAKFPMLMQGGIRHFILWGPPGCGKTSLVYLLSKIKSQNLHTLNAVLQGVPDLKKVLKTILKSEALFIDEIHRFNKAQQDALLPSLEAGDFSFYGATTENPYVTLNAALRSRVNILQISSATEEQVAEALKNICQKEDKTLKDETIQFLAYQAKGDMRLGISLLEIAFEVGEDQEKLTDTFRELNLLTSDAIDRYYHLISALIKSMRGSDPNSAILYLANLIEEGHDLNAVCRRLVIFASEDVGNADPSALTMAIDCLNGFQSTGLPEGRIILGQTVSYLASTHKSNRSYQAINHALAHVRENGPSEIPEILKNTKSSNYLYPHNYPKSYVKQEYSVGKIPKFYDPSELGREGQLKARLDSLTH
jgi:putative ATPase